MAVTTYFGPVAAPLLGPKVAWTSEADAYGIRKAQFTGRLTRKSAQQLSELVANRGRRITIGGSVGVLEYVYTDHDFLRDHNGWYLLSQMQYGGGAFEGFSGAAEVTIEAAYLGDATTRQLVVTRSARTRTNVYGLSPTATVVGPLWLENSDGTSAWAVDPGGTAATRDYDPTFPQVTAQLTATGRKVAINSRAFSGSTDLLPSVVLLASRFGVEFEGQGVPRWVSDRGGDVRAYDRREAREVYGPAHPFRAPTDIEITNGVLRFWVGNARVTPFLNVSAFISGAWREVGCVQLAAAATTAGARLVSCSPENATVAVDTFDGGTVFVTLRRGERMLRVQHGANRAPTLTIGRALYWLGTPPARQLDATANTSSNGKFSKGLSFSDGGLVDFYWPVAQTKNTWTVAGWWVPPSASSSQGDSGIVYLKDSAGVVADVSFVSSSKTLRFTVGANAVSSGALTFSANVPVFFAARFSTTSGMALTSLVTGGTVGHAANTSYTATGTTDATYASLVIGAAKGDGSTTWGSGTWGSGTWGGPLTLLSGVVDNVMIFEDLLSNADAAALSAAATALGGLPASEGRLVWYAPFDAGIHPVGSVVGNGRRYETTAVGGTTRNPDGASLTKAIAMLPTGTASGDFGMVGSGTTVDFGVYLATTATADDLADHHNQLAAQSEQELRVR